MLLIQNIKETYLNVINDEPVHIKTFVVSVGLSIPQQLEQELSRLLRPATLCGAELLGLRAATNSTVEAAERNALLLFSHILQVPYGTAEGQLLDSHSGLICVLQVRDGRFKH